MRNKLDGYDIEDLQPGMSARFSKTITEADIVLFAGASGDSNAMCCRRPKTEPLGVRPKTRTG